MELKRSGRKYGRVEIDEDILPHGKEEADCLIKEEIIKQGLVTEACVSCPNDLARYEINHLGKKRNSEEMVHLFSVRVRCALSRTQPCVREDLILKEEARMKTYAENKYGDWS